MVILVGEGHVSRGQPRPHFQGTGPQHSPILGILLHLFGVVTHMGVYDFRGRLKPMHILQNLLHGLSETAEFLAQGVIMPHSVRAEALT